MNNHQHNLQCIIEWVLTEGDNAIDNKPLSEIKELSEEIAEQVYKGYIIDNFKK
jgi:hypothetical protein